VNTEVKPTAHRQTHASQSQGGREAGGKSEWGGGREEEGGMDGGREADRHRKKSKMKHSAHTTNTQQTRLPAKTDRDTRHTHPFTAD
jgi:hypothetical protein